MAAGCHKSVRACRAAPALGLILAASCAVSGITHKVRPGENLYRIGKAYGVDYTELARINSIRSPYRLQVGDRLYVPHADRQLPVNVITPRSVSSARPKWVSSPTPKDSRVGSAGFSWPTRGMLSSGFGKRERGHHDGIDISTPKGTPVYAARDGKVIFSDRLSSYGNVIIVEHGDGFTTVYAHNENNLVRKGSRIRRGERIATVGQTGRARGSHLHFEIRKDNVARNPLYYLPRASAASVAAAQ